MGKNNLKIVISAKDLTKNTFDKLSKRLDNAKKASNAFAVGLAAVGAGVGLLGKSALSAAGDYEQSQIAFSTMLGSAEKANKLLGQLATFAKETPFELKGIEDQAKKLLAYGVGEDKIIETTRMLGDIAAGVGMDKLPNLTLAFGQVKAATRLTGMELRQFTEAGVPLLDELAKTMGVSVKEVQALVSKGEVGFPIVQEAIKNLTGEGGRFEGMMEKQSKSLGGMVSNLSDSWALFLRGEGKKLLEWGKKFTAWAIYVVENILPKMITKIEETTKWFGEHKVVIAIVAGAILGALVPALYAAVAAFAALALSLAPFIIGGAIIGGLVYGIYWLVKNWDLVKEKMAVIWESIKSVWHAGVDKLNKFIDGMIEKISKLIQKIKDGIEWLKKYSGYNAVKSGVSSAWNYVSGKKAGGGFVGAGKTYLVGERGPELFKPNISGSIIPNNQLAGAGGGINITITGNTLLDHRAGERIGDMIIKKLGFSTKL